MSSDDFKELLSDIKHTFIVGRIMTPRENLVYYEDSKDSFNKVDFDVLPKTNLKKYWYKKDRKIHKISTECIISYHLDLLSFIDCLKDNDFYFVIHGKEIEGIVHFSDLKKQPVRILFYILISALELKLQQFYKGKDKLIKDKLGKKRISEIDELIKSDKKINQEMSILNYLNFADFLSILAKDKMFLKRVGYTRKRIENEFNSLNALRNWIAHPTRQKIDACKSIKEFLIEGKEKLFVLHDLLEQA